MTMCRNLFIPFPFYSFSSFPFLSDIAYFSLIFWKVLRLVLLINNLPLKKCANSNLKADRSNFLSNKTVMFVLGLYM